MIGGGSNFFTPFSSYLTFTHRKCTRSQIGADEDQMENVHIGNWAILASWTQLSYVWSFVLYSFRLPSFLSRIKLVLPWVWICELVKKFYIPYHSEICVILWDLSVFLAPFYYMLQMGQSNKPMPPKHFCYSGYSFWFSSLIKGNIYFCDRI